MARLIDMTYLRYGLASVCALAADVAMFTALMSAGMMASLASGAGYGFGIGVHWLISSRVVFARQTHVRGSDQRRQQKLLFAGSALLGLGLTMCIVGAGTGLGLDPSAAKAIAVIVSFQAIWLVRRLYVFAS
jgi:putative flippase GtrA|tara:strand:+ start:63927 stop:64322 length:396 start_codon:yes stop_codon:yes gene_type:complete